MKLKEIKELSPIEKEIPDDIYINCVSFEERGIKSLIHSNGYRAKNIFILDYPELHRRDAPAKKRIKENRKIILDKVEEYAENKKNIFLVGCSRSEPLEGYFQFLDICDTLGLNSVSPNLKITIDISVLTKAYLLVMLKAIETLSANKVRIIYTEPAYYYPDRLTYGISSIGYIPLYNGNLTPLKHDLLIVFLGFEGERAFAIWEHFEPQRAIGFIGNPGFRPAYVNKAEELNEAFLHEKGVEKREVSAIDYEDVCQQLESVWKNNQGRDLLISPLGTKIQAVGVYLFKRNNPNCAAQVVYASPLKYLKNYYSRGSGQMFEAFL